MTTIAWFCAYGQRWIGLLALFLALLAIVLVGVVFDWNIPDILTTVIPCTCILLAGFFHMRKHRDQQVLSRCVMLTATIAVIWLASAGCLQLMLALLAPKRIYLYTWVEYTIDLRFYVGWVIGLAVAPRPAVSHSAVS
jgi:purine-cytosine permease-like protein